MKKGKKIFAKSLHIYETLNGSETFPYKVYENLLNRVIEFTNKIDKPVNYSGQKTQNKYLFKNSREIKKLKFRFKALNNRAAKPRKRIFSYYTQNTGSIAL